MILLIRNTSGDRTRVTQHRSAAGFVPVISIGGVRLNAGQQMYIDSAHFERIADSMAKLYQDGVIEITNVDTDKAAKVRLLTPENAPQSHVNLHGASGEASSEVTAPTAVVVDKPEEEKKEEVSKQESSVSLSEVDSPPTTSAPVLTTSEPPMATTSPDMAQESRSQQAKQQSSKKQR